MSDQKRAFELNDFLSHIHEAIQRIEVIRNFEVIGEASRNIEKCFPDFVVVHPELPSGIRHAQRAVSRLFRR
ncbi:MAG: ribonuclease HepT family protein [Acidobacteriaceae bacterium]